MSTCPIEIDFFGSRASLISRARRLKEIFFVKLCNFVLKFEFSPSMCDLDL